MDYKVVTISKNDNNAGRKNQIIEECIKDGTKYVFIVQDDLTVKEEAYEMYISLMKRFAIPCVYYGFYGRTNRLFNGKPNPLVKLTSKKGNLMLTRNVADAFIGLDINRIGKVRFKAAVPDMHLDMFLLELKENMLIPFFGFFFDIWESWNYISEEKEWTPLLQKDLIELKAKKNDNMNRFRQEKGDVKPSLDLDGIVNYIKGLI